jgi:2-polyprenyl-3-methyl-5-hydroxy-6-metoxy-1,4-benzoquinol methylase
MEENNINTQEYWDLNYSRGFYQDNSSQDWAFNHEFIRRALPQKPCRILELACGLGHNAKFVASLGHSVIATDFSHVAIEENKKRFTDPKIRYDCLSLEEATDFFIGLDAVMAFEIIEHYKKPLIPLLKISKCLKEGGLFIFSVPHEHGHYGVWCQHYSLWNYDQLGKMLFMAGFKQFTIFKTDFSHENIMGVAVK